MNPQKYRCLNTLFTVAIILLGVSSSVYAINPNSELPIKIESDRASLNDETGISTYIGNVIISQGQTRLEADNISVNSQNRQITSIKAIGSPAHFVQHDALKDTHTHGYGDAIIYISKDETLKFIGHAKFVQQENSFSGEQIEYDILKKAIKAQGDETIGSRVKVQYQPKKQEAPKIITPIDEVNISTQHENP